MLYDPIYGIAKWQMCMPTRDHTPHLLLLFKYQWNIVAPMLLQEHRSTAALIIAVNSHALGIKYLAVIL